VSLTARVVDFLERRPRPVTARLVAMELDANVASVSCILLELVRLQVASRCKPGGVYRYELVRR
jgi:DNA-binding IclR family transcriptional regulator